MTRFTRPRQPLLAEPARGFEVEGPLVEQGLLHLKERRPKPMTVALRHAESLFDHAQHVAPLPDVQQTPGEEEVAEQIVETVPDFE